MEIGKQIIYTSLGERESKTIKEQSNSLCFPEI